MSFDHVLLTWSEYGEHPHELFSDPEELENLRGYNLDQFIQDLKVPLNYSGSLYRTILGPDSGEILNYNIPTSWSKSLEVVKYMAIGQHYILVISGNNIEGVYNDQNQYGEEECILAPMKLKMIRKQDDMVHCDVVQS